MKFPVGTPVYVVYSNETIREATVIGEQNTLSLRRLRLSMVVGDEIKETVADESMLARVNDKTQVLVEAARACRKDAEVQLQLARANIASLLASD